jgi:competence transcription factor ComK
MLLELNVYYYPDDYDPDSAENLGKKPKITQGIMVINTHHIVAYNPNDNGHAMVRLSNGEVFETVISFEAFRRNMEGAEIAKNMLVSGEN